MVQSTVQTGKEKDYDWSSLQVGTLIEWLINLLG